MRSSFGQNNEYILAKESVEKSHDVIISILQFLDPLSIAKYALVNTFWNTASNNPHLWKPFAEQKKIDRIKHNPYKFLVELSEAHLLIKQEKMRLAVIEKYRQSEIYLYSQEPHQALTHFIEITKQSKKYVEALYYDIFPFPSHLLNPDFVKATFENPYFLNALKNKSICGKVQENINKLLEIKSIVSGTGKFHGSNYSLAFQFIFNHGEIFRYVFKNINKFMSFKYDAYSYHNVDNTLSLCIHFFSLIPTKLKDVTLSDIENLIISMNKKNYSSIYKANKFIPEHLKDPAIESSMKDKFLSYFK